MAVSVIAFPANPTLNQSVTCSNNIVYVWDGEKWTSLGAITSTNVTAAVGTSAPSNPVTGSLWYDSTNSLLKVYQSGQWTDVRPSS